MGRRFVFKEINMYDYLIVGSGLFGSVFAREMTDKGYKCLVIDKRSHIGGNCYTESVDGINVHKYGPHIFHTSDSTIWEYINRFTKFNNFVNRPKVNYEGKIYSFPINLMTLFQVYGVTTPDEAFRKLEEVREDIQNPKNLEEWILSQVGPDLYKIFIKGYTKKQWNRDPKYLPSSIIRRLPIRLSFEDNYFTDAYQGIPIGGYTQIFEKLLNGIEVKLGCDYFENREYFDNLATKVVYTGPIDLFYSNRFESLDYRSLSFETHNLNMPDYQGVALMNYTKEDVPFTRITEHKHFEFGTQKNTVVTMEYPQSKGDPYYPINDDENNKKYKHYKDLMDQETKYIFGGRLTDYKYYDMHQVIGSALHKSKKETIYNI
jgi:UDP-galactopyranose mutase